MVYSFTVLSTEVTLSPGDVLYVPPGWWHEVVTTSAWAISVNTWLAVSGDATARLGEALVRLTIAGIVRAASSEVFNPINVSNWRFYRKVPDRPGCFC